MKVIFLDIDGVLNCSETTARSVYGAIGIDDEKVKNLAHIVEQTGAEIVLTSTWGMWWSKNDSLHDPEGCYMVEKLSAYGLHIYDKVSYFWDRGEAIVTWLLEHPDVKDWIAIDDDMFPDFKANGIIPHLVRTNFYKGGLLERHVKKAVTLLHGHD